MKEEVVQLKRGQRMAEAEKHYTVAHEVMKDEVVSRKLGQRACEAEKHRS